MSPYRIRVEVLPDDALVVVRGGSLDPNVLRFDALAARDRFGECGISVFAAEDDAGVDDLARHRLRFFPTVALMRAGVIRAAGLELRPTFRRPHYTIMLPDLDEDIGRLIRCENVTRANPHYEPPGSL